MTTIEFQRGITAFQRFPVTCTVEQLREDLAALDWDAVDADGVDDPREAVAVLGSAVEGQTMALLVVSGWVDHEETGQDVAEEPRDVLDAVARRLVPGHVAVADNQAFRGRSASRWAVDARGARVSLDLADLETLVLEQLDCSAGVPDLH